MLKDQIQEIKTAHHKGKSSGNELSQRMIEVERKLLNLDMFTRQLVASEVDQTKLQIMDHPSTHIKNDDTGIWHKTAIDGLGHPPNRWRTKCGWPFGLNRFSRCSGEPPLHSKKCDKCFNSMHHTKDKDEDGESASA